MISRTLGIKIQHSLTIEKCVAVCGARQVGKTTLVKAIGQDIDSVYYNLDFPDVREHLKTNGYREFKHHEKKLIIIDEIQKLPELFEIIKIVIDETPSKKGRFLITGSSQILLLKNISDTLAGRLRIFNLFPLTLQELTGNANNKPLLTKLIDHPTETDHVINDYYLDIDNIKRFKAVLQTIIECGSYPEMLERTDPEDIRIWYQSYRAAYLERDIADIARISELDNFSRCHKLAAARAAQVLNYSDISKELAMSVNSVKQYIHYLEISFQTFLMQPFFSNIEKRLTKTPKLYFYDTGILRSLINNFESTTGSLYENFVVSELNRLLSYHHPTLKLYFLKAHSGMEIDVIIETAQINIAVEIKSSKKAWQQDGRHIKTFQKLSNKKTVGVVLYRGNAIIGLDENIYAIPDCLFLN